MSRIDFQFSLPYRITHRRKWVVACCPALDICSQGDTVEDAKRNLTEATRVFLVSCYERGVLEKVLSECGFKHGGRQVIRQKATRRQIQVSIPLQSAPQARCHA